MKRLVSFHKRLPEPLCLKKIIIGISVYPKDATKFEFYGRKLDASLFVFGSHNKKRPNNLVFARLYDYNILDMIELGKT